MKIFKFGGASVKDSDGVKNLVKILNYLGQQQTLIVISAMGKTTNSLELLVKNYFDNKDDLQYSLNEVFNFHNKILDSMDLKYKNRSLNSILENNTLNHDKLIKKTGILFKKVEDDN